MIEVFCAGCRRDGTGGDCRCEKAVNLVYNSCSHFGTAFLGFTFGSHDSGPETRKEMRSNTGDDRLKVIHLIFIDSETPNLTCLTRFGRPEDRPFGYELYDKRPGRE